MKGPKRKKKVHLAQMLCQVNHANEMGMRAVVVFTTGSRRLLLPHHIQCMPSPASHLMWSKGHTRWVRISSRHHQGRIINHTFTTAFHALLSCIIILPCSTDIPLSFNTPFTPSIHPILDLPLNLTPLTSDHTIFFTNRSSTILSMCV